MYCQINDISFRFYISKLISFYLLVCTLCFLMCCCLELSIAVCPQSIQSDVKQKEKIAWKSIPYHSHAFNAQINGKVQFLFTMVTKLCYNSVALCLIIANKLSTPQDVKENIWDISRWDLSALQTHPQKVWGGGRGSGVASPQGWWGCSP